jgi:hypothetical protein
MGSLVVNETKLNIRDSIATITTSNECIPLGIGSRMYKRKDFETKEILNLYQGETTIVVCTAKRIPIAWGNKSHGHCAYALKASSSTSRHYGSFENALSQDMHLNAASKRQ